MENKENLGFTRCRVALANCLGESVKSVLIGIEGKKAFWIDKKYVYPTGYTLYANVNFVDQWTYNVFDWNDSKKYDTVKAGTLINYFNKQQPGFFKKIEKKTKENVVEELE